jgi:hypothetical protein
MRRLPRLIIIITMAAGVAPCQRVTAEKKVEIDGTVQTVRKINGRWWSPDNRQLTPQKDGYTWYIGRKGYTWTFHHHRSVNLELAESLHLFMGPASVENLLGEPNESAGRENWGSRAWMYYAADGTALLLQFGHDELALARYERPDYGLSGKPVQSVERDLDGRDAYKVMADRAWQRNSPSEYAKFHKQDQGAGPAMPVVSVAPAASAPDPPKRRIAADLAGSVKEGMSRSEVVRIMGEPSGGMHVAGGENDFEVMTYSLDPSGEVSLRLEKGKVVRISR